MTLLVQPQAAATTATTPLANFKPPTTPGDGSTAAPSVRPGAAGQTVKVASTPQVSSLVSGWSAQLAPRIPGALQQPAAAVNPVLARLLPSLFNANARVLTVPGVAPLTDRATESTALGQSVSTAFTEPRLQAIERLQTDGQRTMVNSLVAASISAYQGGALTQDQLGQAIDWSIREAEGYRAPPLQTQTQGTQPAPVADQALPQPPAARTPDLALAQPPASQPQADVNNDPMRPIPDLTQLQAQAKAQLTPEVLQRYESQGLSYRGTGVLINIRHGQTDGNRVRGGYFAGNLRGPDGAQLTDQARAYARSLGVELQQVAPQVDKVFYSPVDRAQQTFELATDVPGLENLRLGALPADDARERGIGGMFGLKKPVPDSHVFFSPDYGVYVGTNEDGNIGFDINRMGRDFAPANVPFATDLFPRQADTDGRGESWNQMYRRVNNWVQRDVLPELAANRNVLVFNHQYVIGNETAGIYGNMPGGVGQEAPLDPVQVGHHVPNTAPLYWVLNVFEKADGSLVAIPAIAGQSQLTAPGAVPPRQP